MEFKFARQLVFASACMLAVSTTQAQSVFDKIGTAVSEGTAGITLRYRLEHVEQDNALRDATASTLRTRLTWTSGQTDGFSAILEVDNVSTIGADHYDSFVTDKYRGRYSVIADPVGTEVNQALLRYKPDAMNTFLLGMQRLNHAAQRFVGSVAWRQNEQTFDAATWQRRDAKLDFDYSYLWNVNRIFGTSKSSVQAANLDSDSHIALGNYKTDIGAFGFYAYALDFKDAAALSSLTYGISWGRQIDKFSLNASLARQSDYGDNPQSYTADYFAADVGYNFGVANLIIGYELLGSDSGRVAFATPLATLHKWQGWTDLFLTTPASGVEDRYVTLSGKFGDASWSATYHDLDSDDTSNRFGDEWDLVASYPLSSKLTAELKYASFDRDTFAVDTDKFWFSLNLAF